MELDYLDGRDMIVKLDEVQREERIWEAWLTTYPLMMTGQMEVEEYDDYKKRSQQKRQEALSEEDIWEDVEGILAEFKV